MESSLRKRAARERYDQDHGKGAMRGTHVDSPPLTDEEIADIREFFAGDWVEEAARRREYVGTVVKEELRRAGLIGKPIAAHPGPPRNGKCE